MIHYIYRIDFLCGEPGRYYLGKRSYRGKKIERDSYAGSGNFCKEYYAEYNAINNKTYKKTILEINETWEINRDREEIVIGDLWRTDPLCMNRCPGGDGGKTGGRPVKQYDLKGNLIAKYDSIKQAQEELNVFQVRECCIGNPNYKTVGGFIWRFEDDSFDKYSIPKRRFEHKYKKVRVNQYHIDGTFIKTWDGMQEASKAIGNTENANSIRACAYHLGRWKTWYGYRWELYNGSTEDIEPLTLKIKPYYIAQYDLNDNFIAQYKSLNKAAKAIGHTYTEGIRRCAEGLQESSNGYKWKFVNE